MTFITDKVKREIEIEGVETRLSTMLGHKVINVTKIDGLIAEWLDRGAKVKLPKTYTKECIPSRKDRIPTPEVAEKWPHLGRINDKILTLNKILDVGLLNGCNCHKAIKPKEVITGKSEDSNAVGTFLGWSLVGSNSTTTG